MSSRTSYREKHGRSGKRWSGKGGRGARHEPLDGFSLHRFPIPDIHPEDVRAARAVKRAAKRLAKRNKRRESRLELYEQQAERKGS